MSAVLRAMSDPATVFAVLVLSVALILVLPPDPPVLEVRKPPGSLHAGTLPPSATDVGLLPGQAFHHGDSYVEGIDVHLGVLGAATGASTQVTLVLIEATSEHGTYHEADRATTTVTGPGWAHFGFRGWTDGPWYRFHLTADGDLPVVPWLRPRGRLLRHGGWGDQAREVEHYRGELELVPGAPLPSALVFPSLGLGRDPVDPARPALLRLLDTEGGELARSHLAPGPLDGPRWLWFALPELPPDAAPVHYELDLPPGTALVGSGGAPRPTLVTGHADPAAFHPMGFLRGERVHRDRDLLFRVHGPPESSTFGERLSAQRASRRILGGSLALLGAGLVLAATLGVARGTRGPA